jgi:lipoprotein-releasing system ATP-binding protein
MNNGDQNILLRASNLHKSYRLGQTSLEVLCGVSLAVIRGEFLALRGASGAGKSTLLHLLGGLDLPNAGEVWFEDQNLGAISVGELARIRNRRIGLIFQAYHLLPELDALENVCLPARISRLGPQQAKERAQALLDRVGLGHRMNHLPTELSGGEQQRVAIARALINEPTLVLADEPTGNLDSHTGEGILHLLCSLREEHHTTLIIATHDEHVAVRAARVLQLADGRILLEQ